MDGRLDQRRNRALELRARARDSRPASAWVCAATDAAGGGGGGGRALNRIRGQGRGEWHTACQSTPLAKDASSCDGSSCAGRAYGSRAPPPPRLGPVGTLPSECEAVRLASTLDRFVTRSSDRWMPMAPLSERASYFERGSTPSSYCPVAVEVESSCTWRKCWRTRRERAARRDRTERRVPIRPTLPRCETLREPAGAVRTCMFGKGQKPWVFIEWTPISAASVVSCFFRSPS